MAEVASDDPGFTISAIVREDGVRIAPPTSTNEADSPQTEPNAVEPRAASPTTAASPSSAGPVALNSVSLNPGPTHAHATDVSANQVPASSDSALQSIVSHHANSRESASQDSASDSVTVPSNFGSSSTNVSSGSTQFPAFELPGSTADGASTPDEAAVGTAIPASTVTPPPDPSHSSIIGKPESPAPTTLVADYDSDSSDSAASSQEGIVEDGTGNEAVNNSTSGAQHRQPLLKKTRRRVRFSTEVQIRTIPNKETIRQQEIDAYMQHMIQAPEHILQQAAEVVQTEDQLDEEFQQLQEELFHNVDVHEEDMAFAEVEDEREDLAQKRLQDRVAGLRNKLKRCRGDDAEESGTGPPAPQPEDGEISNDGDENLAATFSLRKNKKRRIMPEEQNTAMPEQGLAL